MLQGTIAGAIGDDGQGGLAGSYVATLEGDYNVVVSVLGVAITDTAWTARTTYCAPGDINQQRTTAAGSGLLNARMAIAAEFVITARDAYDNQVKVNIATVRPKLRQCILQTNFP